MMDDLIRRAAEEYVCAVDSRLTVPEDTYVDFSANFEKKMRRLIAKTKNTVSRLVLRIVASVVLAVLLLLGSTITLDVDAREAILGWIKEQYTSFARFVFTSEGKMPYSESYCPEWIPQGYQYYNSCEIQNGRAILYANESGDILQFTYSTAPESLELYLFTEDYIEREVCVSGTTGILYTPYIDSESSELVWQNGTGTIFLVSGKCGDSVLMRFAENISKK